MSKGFTLIELAIVIAILGFVSVLLLISWPNASLNLEAQAQQLAGDIRYIQFLSMSGYQRYRINFSSNQYTLTALNGTTAVNQPATNSNVIALPSGVTLSSTNLPSNYLVFDSIGAPYTTNTIPGTALTSNAVITLTSGSSTKTITITAQTGKVSVP